MARIRQIYPNNYRTSNNVSAEFENLIRYLVAAERGNKTLAELMKSIFDEMGEFAPPIEFRVDAIAGFQYRIGEYEDSEDGWNVITDIQNLRGPSGVDVGFVDSPFFYNRVDIVATSGQTVFPFQFDESAMDVLVYQNGVLLGLSSYTKQPELHQITLGSGAALNDVITIAAIRDAEATGYTRSDYDSAENQAVFPAGFEDNDTLVVYLNGILQREGGLFDYVSSLDLQTVTFMTPLEPMEKVTVIRVQNNSLRRILGLMTENKWTDGTGFIPYTKLKIEAEEIPQTKIDELIPSLAKKITTYISASEPSSPETPSLWIQTSGPLSILWFYDGTSWRRTTPVTTLPDFSEANAGEFIAVSQGGDSFELTNVDLSAVVPKAWVGAANGVASLDSGGRLPEFQVPDIFAIQSLSLFKDGAVANGNLNMSMIYRQTVKIDGVSARVSAGSCNIQLSVDGAGVGPVVSVSTTQNNLNLADIIQIDTTSQGKRLGVIVTSNASAQNLEVGVSAVSRNA